VDRSIGSPRTRSVVGVRGLGVSVFGLPLGVRYKRQEYGLLMLNIGQLRVI